MIKVGVAFSLSYLGLTVNNASKSNVNDNSPKLASTTSPGVCRPTVGYNWRLAYKKLNDVVMATIDLLEHLKQLYLNDKIMNALIT